MKVIWTICVSLCILPSGISLGQGVNDNLPALAEEIASTTVEHLKTHLPTAGKHGIAVLAFGDETRKYPKRLGTLGPQLQGQTIETLKDTIANATVGTDPLAAKFSVASYEFMVETFQNTTTHVGGLTDENLSLARSVLEEEDLEVAIVGHFQLDGTLFGRDTIPPTVTVSVTVVFPNDHKVLTLRIKASEILLHIPNGGDGGDPGLDPNNLPDDSVDLSSRFKVEFFGRPAGQTNLEKIPLRVVTDQGSPLFNALILLIDEARYKGREYEIRITNKANRNVSFLDGAPGDPADQQRGKLITNPARDEDRTFLLSAYVDGVSMIKRRTTHANGVVSFDKDVRSYAFVSKYVLTGPNRRFVRDTSVNNERFRHAKLLGVPGPGHSVLDIKGFLKINQNGSHSTSTRFVFGDSSDSVGQEFIGTGVSQIGVISLFLFAERFDDDQQSVMLKLKPAETGTLEGDSIPTPTIKVGVKNVYKVPIETWQIVYKYKTSDDPNTLPVDD